MDSVAVLHSFQYAISTSSSFKSVLEKPAAVACVKNSSYCSLSKLPISVKGKYIPSANRHRTVYLSCAKTPETTITTKSNTGLNGAALPDSQSEESIKKKSSFKATFPKVFESLLPEICDETNIAELKVKFGAFEMHMKRNIEDPTASAPIAPPVPSILACPTPATTPAPPESPVENTNPFKNVAENSSKLAALEASGSTGYVIVPSPMVGLFRRGKTVNGKESKPAIKEGDVIKEGQILVYVKQFDTELAVRSDVDGEVLKILFSDGERVGYGDPLVVIHPSFHYIGVQ